MNKRLICIILTLAMVITLIKVTPATTVKAEATINIGDYIQMGKYYDEPILWRCVDIDENGPLMLSDRILCIKPFDAAGDHKYLDDTTQADTYGERQAWGSNLWETSNMRSWLNSTASAGNVTWLDGCPPAQDKVFIGYNDYANEKGFLTDGNFTSSERNAIKTVTQKSILNEIDVSKLSQGGTAIHHRDADISYVVGNYDTAYYQNVTDKMFLLDVKQLNKVYQNSTTLGTNYYKGKLTQKAVDNSEYKDSEMNTSNYWHNWTRTPCANSYAPSTVRLVHTDGYVNYSDAHFCTLGARPAFYLNLQSSIFKSGNGLVGSPYSLDAIVTSVKMSKSTVSLKVLQTVQLTASILPSNTFNKSVKWTSSSTKVATVSSTGKVTAKAPGAATITVTTVSGAKTATCKVTVTQPVISVKLNKTTLSLLKGKTTKLIPTINPSNASNKKVTWKSSNKSIATVSSTGTVKGIKKGTAYIYVYSVDGKKSAKCKVVVK